MRGESVISVKHEDFSLQLIVVVSSVKKSYMNEIKEAKCESLTRICWTTGSAAGNDHSPAM